MKQTNKIRTEKKKSMEMRAMGMRAIGMRAIGLAAIGMLAIGMTGCEQKYPQGKELKEGVSRVAEYLYEKEYTDYEPGTAMRLMEQEDLIPGACTVVRNGQYVGRNFDWLYDTSVEFVIRVPHTEAHYASVGMAGGIPTFTATMVEKAEDTDFYDALPYITLDGVNEHGVFCSINMLPAEDDGVTDNTLPGADSLGMLMVPRYVLDHAATAEEAVEMLRRVNIIRCKAMTVEGHFLIADSTATYVVEWQDGTMLAARDSFRILTNFYLLQPKTPHSQGIERYDYAKAHYATAATLAGMTELMHALRFSRLYDRETSPYWYSDYNGDWTQYGLGDLTIDSEPEDYEKCIRNDLRHYRLHRRDYRLDIWHTKHTGIYDLRNKSVLYYVQEDYSQYYRYGL